MPRPRHSPLLLVIAGAGIIIFKQNGDRSARGSIVEDATPEYREIGFLPGSSAFLGAAFPPFNIGQEIIYR
jgi:hypothetical protein